MSENIATHLYFPRRPQSQYEIDTMEINVVTDFELYDIEPEQEDERIQHLTKLQERKLKELMGDAYAYQIVFLPSHFGNGITYFRADIDSVLDEVQCLAIKNGVDLVQFPDGNYGFISYYNSKRDGFKIIPVYR